MFTHLFDIICLLAYENFWAKLGNNDKKKEKKELVYIILGSQNINSS